MKYDKIAFSNKMLRYQKKEKNAQIPNTYLETKHLLLKDMIEKILAYMF